MGIRRLLVVGLAWALASTLAVQPAGAPAAVAQTPALMAGQEFDTGAAGNNAPWGIWSDGDTLWVVDGRDDEIYAYDTATKARKPSEDFDEDRLDDDNDDLEGIWSDGATLWVTDENSNKIFAYNLQTKQRAPAEEFDTLEDAGNRQPGGIWSDGATMWVADWSRDKIFAYDLQTKERAPAEEFDTLWDAGNRHPGGIWSDGDTMWVADWWDGKVYAYDRASKQRAPLLDFVAEGVERPLGLWRDPMLGRIILVSDLESETVRALVLPEPPDAPTGVAAAGGDGRLTVTWSAGNEAGSSAVVGYEVRHRRRNAPDQAWRAVRRSSPLALTEAVAGLVNHTLYDVEVRAVNSETRSAWTAAAGVPTDAAPAAGAPGAPTNLAADIQSRALTVTWSAPSNEGDSAITGYEVRYRDAGGPPSTQWVSRMDSLGTPAVFITSPVAFLTPYDVQVRALNDAGGGHWATAAAGGTFNLHDDNRGATGLWSDGTTVWVADIPPLFSHTSSKIIAYSETGERTAGEDFNTLDEAGNDDPQGIWSDGMTMWVADSQDDKIYAYDLDTKMRDPDEDFYIDLPDGELPADIWSDGVTMWVVDDYRERILAYDLATKRRKPSEGFDVLPGRYPEGIWSDGITMWISSFDSRRVEAHNLETKERDRSLDFSVPGMENLGSMWSNGRSIWVNDWDYGRRPRFIRVALPSRPGRPADLAAAGGDSQLELRWQAAPGHGIVRYEVQWRGDAPNSGWTAVVRSDPAALAETVSLDNGTYYEMRVRAVNDAGFAGAWALAEGTPAPAGAPEQPLGLEVSGASETGDEGGGDRALDVKWQEQTGVDYEARYRLYDPDRGPWRDATVSGASARIAGLLEGRHYQVQVRAVDAGVAGPWTAAGNRAGRGFYSLDPDNSDPRGIWSDETTMWVSDWENPKIFAYDMATKERDPLKDFDTLEISGNDLAAGLWGDSQRNTMWVGHTGEVRSHQGRVFAYHLDTTEKYDDDGFSGEPGFSPMGVLRRAGNNGPHGVCSDGDTLWVSDRSDVKVYAYDISSERRDSSKDFDDLVDPDASEDFDRSQSRPTGMWCNSDTMWIADADTNRIYAYDMGTRQRDRLRDIPAHDGLRSSGRLYPNFGSDPYGLWSDGETMWVLDDDEDRIVPVVLPDPPGEPRRLRPDSSVNCCDSMATVFWDAPNDYGSSPVESYELRYRAQDTDGEWTTESSVPVPVSGSPTTTITGLTNGTTYDVQVRAVNAETASEWAEGSVEPRAAPGEPRNLSASPGNESLLVAWDEPDDDGGRDIRGYEVSHRDPASVDDWTVPTSVGLVTRAQIGSLANGTAYDVRVRAWNSAGDGDWASTSAMPASVSGPPSRVEAKPDDRSLTVTWDVPADTGGLTLSGYDVQYRQKPADEEPGGSWAGAERVAASPLVISGLTNGTVYEVRVRARNSAGQSGWSDAAEGTPATAPGLPRNLSASPSDMALVADWDEPADDGGDPVSGYDVQYRDPASANDWREVSATGTQAQIDSLINGTVYEVRVRAENEEGESGWAQTRGKPATVPSAPRNLAVSAGGGKLVVTWEAPADIGGSAVLDYSVQHRVGDPQGSWSTETPVPVPVSGSPTTTIDGLDNGTSYDVRVRARNDNDHGPFATGSAMPTSVPGAPRSLAVEPGEVASGGGKLVVSWEAPADGGGKPIDRYLVRYRGAGSGSVISVEESTSVTIEGLDNGTVYEVRVSARNDNGYGPAVSASSTPFTVPGPPGGVEADPGDRTLDVTWQAPADDGGSPVTRHEVRYRAEAATGSWTAARRPSAPAAGSSTWEASLGSLVNGRTYVIQVRAVNEGGPGPWAQTAGTPVGRPGRPTSLDVRQGENPSELVVEWSLPEGVPAGQIQRYDVQHRTSGARTPWTPVTPGAGSLSVTVDGLVGGRSYDVQVRAVTAGGPGPWSSGSGTPRVPPGLSVGDTTVREDQGPAVFEVVLSEPARREVSVDYATQQTTGSNATEDVDYDSAAGTLTFEPGETSKTFEVQITDDDMQELSETFGVTLSNPQNAELNTERGSATATILDDDTPVVGPGPSPGPSGPGPSGPGPSGGGEEPVAQPRAGFVDVDPSGVHAANIDALFAAGITVGCSTEPLQFCPGDAVIRAQMATFLARALDLEPPEAPAGFVDVDPSGVHAANIDALFAAGITVGCSTEPLQFCPGDAVIRAQMATFLARALDLEPPEAPAGFVDVDPSGVPAANIDALFAAGITVGCSSEPLEFCPSAAVTRAQMATFLARALDLQPSAEP